MYLTPPPLQEAVRLKPTYMEALTGLGVSLKELKRQPEAEACFRSVVQLRPSCALSLGNLAGEATQLAVALACCCCGLMVLGRPQLQLLM